MTGTTCLVLGGGGFIGGNVARALLRKNLRVIVLERPEAGDANLRALSGPVEVVRGDLASGEHLLPLLKRAQYVFHCAGRMVPAESMGSPSRDIELNVLPTLNLLQCLRQHPVRKLVFCSSGGTIYGIPGACPIGETHPTEPICAYGISKLMAEKHLAMHRYHYGLDYVSLRFSNPYGPGQNPQGRQGAIAVFMGRILAGQEIEVWGDGTVVRDYVYIDDAAEAAVRAALGDAGGARVLNIGSGIGRSVNDILEAIQQVVSRRALVRYSPARRIDVPVKVLDIREARRRLDWAPSVDLMEGLRRFHHWLGEQDPQWRPHPVRGAEPAAAQPVPASIASGVPPA